MSEIDLKSEYARRAAQGQIQFIDEMRSASLAQHTDLFKWITASLLAINGGASVTMIGSTSIDAIHKVCAGTNFVVGMFFALFVGVFAQVVSTRSLAPLAELKHYWLSVEVDGERLEELEKTIEARVRDSIKRAWIVPALGWVSGAFFALGLSVVAHGILKADKQVKPELPVAAHKTAFN